MPDSIRTKLPKVTDADGNPIRDLDRYRNEWEDSFQFSFISRAELNAQEKAVWAELPRIFAARSGRPTRVKEVRVSETMRLVPGGFTEAVGVWDSAAGCIVVKRSQLATVREFAGTVLHESAHAISDAADVTLAFEEALTDELGGTVEIQIGPSATPP